MGTNRILLICDHNLDPRLRRKVAWFQNFGLSVDVFHIPKAGWLGEYDGAEKILDQLPDNSEQYSFIYVSGGKIYVDYFYYFLKLKLKGTKVICEVPDLPLRRKSTLQNIVIAFVFKNVIALFASKIIVTSEAFMKFLPRNKPYIEFENLPPKAIADRFIQLRSDKQKKEKIQIAFIGAIRYLEQLQILIRYANERKELMNLLVYGGPEEKLNEVLQKENASLGENILYFGFFNYENDISTIYKEIDMVYSVYDNNQLNVRLALPNKLYEAALSDKPIIVAENTYLSEVVSKHSLGLSLPTKLKEYPLFRKKLDDYLLNPQPIQTKMYSDQIMHKIEHQYKKLLKFVSE